MSSVLHVFNSDAPGGIEVLAPIVYLELIKRGMQTELYLVHKKNPAKKSVFASQGIEFDSGSASGYMCYFAFYKYLRCRKPGIVHIFNCNPITIPIARLAGASKIVYSIRGERFGRNKLHRLVAKVIWGMALLLRPVLISNSGHTTNSFRKKISHRAKIKTIYNPLRFFPQELPLKARKEYLTIIYCGRLEPGKNLILWLDLARDILSYLPNTNFRLFGEGSQKKVLKNHCQELGIADRVEFMGYVENIEQAYHDADLMIFLSKFESFGNVVIECLSFGVPALCSDIPSLKEILREYPEFIVHLEGNLFNEVKIRLAQLEELKIHARRARKEVIKKYSLIHHVNQLILIYSEGDASPSLRELSE